MRLSVIRERLYKGSLFAAKIVTTKSNLPILSNLLLTATPDNLLKIESSNLELSIRLTIAAKVEEPGQITIPAKKFSEFLSLLSDETLTLHSDLRQLVVESNSNQATFVTMPPTDFPELPSRQNQTNHMSFDPQLFRRMVKKVCFAAAGGETHPVLTGALLTQAEEGMLSVVATDSFRLSIYKLPTNAAMNGSIIVPAQALAEVDHLIADSSTSADNVGVFFSREDSQIFFQYGEVEIISRLLEAEYPPYQRIFPTQFVTTGTFNRSQFIEAIRATSLFASREGQAITVKFDKETQTMQLSARSSEVGSHTGKITGVLEGESIQLGFNSRYLLEGVSSIDAEQIRLKISGMSTPVLLEAIDDRHDYQHIVMPMTLNETNA
ncbi:DNA polymerase III subunit beta [candidate division WWE3 bacterium]|nr:DNA polymerase III subunit beta [candidate division WWE3 bacterium]